jgi:Icc-related predicted phosphoesterase
MIIVGLTDIHGHIRALSQLLPKLPDADVILLAGDLTNFGDKQDAVEVLDIIRQYTERVIAIPGNCDRPSVGKYLKEEGISLDGKCLNIDNVSFVGVGGSLPCPGRTPNELAEEEFKRLLNLCRYDIKADTHVVLLTHQPPYGTQADLIGTGRHVGSTSIRRFIDEIKPAVCICGHIHEARSEDKAGDTIVLNPGPADRGYYACVEIDTGLRAAEIRSVSV